MESVKEKDLIVVDNIGEGTVEVKPSCDDMAAGHWYCATHFYHESSDGDFNVHYSDGSNHLVAWICKIHGAEVP